MVGKYNQRAQWTAPARRPADQLGGCRSMATASMTSCAVCGPQMSDDYQILIPPSFIALYTDRRRRLVVTLETLRSRYDLCEDLANQLVDFARGVHFDLGVSEDEVLSRCRRGLLDPPSQVEPAEAQWVERRLAELLAWPWPDEPAAADPG